MAILLRVLVALHLFTRIPDRIKQSKASLLTMTGNPFFLTPNPPRVAVAADLAALEASEALTKSKAKGAAQARNVKPCAPRHARQRSYAAEGRASRGVRGRVGRVPRRAAFPRCHRRPPRAHLAAATGPTLDRSVAECSGASRVPSQARRLRRP